MGIVKQLVKTWLRGYESKSIRTRGLRNPGGLAYSQPGSVASCGHRHAGGGSCDPDDYEDYDDYVPIQWDADYLSVKKRFDDGPVQRVRGEQYRAEQIEKLVLRYGGVAGREGRRIIRYLSTDAQVVPDPENEYDPNAVKVLIDGVHVGFVPKGATGYWRNRIAEGVHTVPCLVREGGESYRIKLLKPSIPAKSGKTS